tara:strand:+ start:368 stop:1480 length:1113 start_codon:yes stop_codon:yes gene_type:complete
MNKRILLFHSSNDLYGASKIILQVIDILNSKNFEIHAFLPYKGPLDELFLKKNVRLNHLNFGVFRKKYFNFFGLFNRVTKILISVFKINNYVKKNNIDLIYTNTSVIIASGISASMCKIPNYLHIHEIPNNNFYSSIMGYLIGKFSKKNIVVSKSVKNYWSKYINKPLELIYNGVPYVGNKGFIKKKSNKIRFLTLARILPYKGHKYIINIAKRLVAQNINVEFIFVGDTFKGYEKYEDELKNLVKEFGIEKQVLFLGFKSDISNYMNSSDFLLHGATRPDPLPTVIFEAIQHNLAVISTNIGGSVEILDKGKGGLLIPHNDDYKSFELISNYMLDYKLVLKKRKYSRNFIKKEFFEEKFNKKILHFFSS